MIVRKIEYLCGTNLKTRIFMITSDQLHNVLEREQALRGYFDIDGKTIQLEEEELRTHDPGFWEDAKRAEVQMKKVKN